MIDRPIFIIGTSRSGTTLIYNLLAIHPDVCWFSTITDALPEMAWPAYLHKIVDMPLIGRHLKQSIVKSTRRNQLIGPREGINIYDNYLSLVNGRKSTEKDKTKLIENKFKKIIVNHLRATGKKRFLSKRPENIQRIRLLNALFPDAYFIHIIRDGRAVANSLLHVAWWSEIEIWWHGGKRSVDWESRGRDPVKLCALHWKNDILEVFRNKKLLKNRYIEIRYESLVKDVKKTIETVTYFCGLRQDTSYYEMVPESVPSTNDKWKRELSSRQQAIVQNTQGTLLRRLHYT